MSCPVSPSAGDVVKTDFAPTHLRCPRCRQEHTLSLEERRCDEREVREGELRCAACGATFEVERGVGHLMLDPPEHITREAAGLGRFAEFMRATGWTKETILELPEGQTDGYWFVQSTGLEQVYNLVEPGPGQWLLDIGSNTCWAANQFAERGLNVIALDIATAEMQGLHTADYFLEEGRSYFERVLGSMYDLPLASSSLDYVYACEVLHHNDPASLRRTFQEAYRVLKPGGKLFVVNETIKTLRDPVGNHAEAVEQFEGYEHAFWTWQYRWAAARAGFWRQTMLVPRYHWFYDPRTPPPRPGNGPVRRFKRAVRDKPKGHRAFLAYLNQVRGGVQMSFVATKPARTR